mmetsp:Transcript_18335/g.25775  ORF Transcript_18335/g.25775 Transcript_18335/m.25775 type:complete len:300 (-) Transcript_18335:47-946(-)|eukprot:CAMPEP_0175101662 /NCGR_PEP_ID=MMETSP0086_2-20121207/7946_1 /TAXON_ID=136419 /ORGANISM="Unknown Unknown, Strain D1" /LENGTH=299 /DNA_ID=CAMNT_0016376267 /DNA_START=28 /DNA_END=927 /DNA_ORIENTATION=+
MTNITDTDLAEYEATQLPRKPTVGPGTYTPRHTLSKPRAPTAAFGKAPRFAGQKNAYISAGHNSDFLCTAGPGPKYLLKGYPNRYSQPAFSMGPSTTTVKKKDKEAAFVASGAAFVGPAAYNPKFSLAKPQTARAIFSKGARFPHRQPFLGKQFAQLEEANFADQVPPNQYNPRDIHTAPAPARWSFGPSNPPKDLRKIKKLNRTTFITHNIQGGSAKPATLECCIGPGHYTPRGVTKTSAIFSKSKRFAKQESQFISKLHCLAQSGAVSPGPKYLNFVGDVYHTSKAKVPKTARLHWL